MYTLIVLLILVEVGLIFYMRYNRNKPAVPVAVANIAAKAMEMPANVEEKKVRKYVDHAARQRELAARYKQRGMQYTRQGKPVSGNTLRDRRAQLAQDERDRQEWLVKWGPRPVATKPIMAALVRQPV